MSILVDMKLRILEGEAVDHVSGVFQQVGRNIEVVRRGDMRVHGSARTTKDQRREIKESGLSERALAKKYGINPKTARRWKKSESIDDKKMGPKKGKFRSVSESELILIQHFLEGNQISLDAALEKLQPVIPQLTRSTLHRIRRNIRQSEDGMDSVESAGALLREIMRAGVKRDCEVLIEHIYRG